MSFVKKAKNVKPENCYATEAQRAALQIGASTSTNNRVLKNLASRRHKVMFNADDQLKRKNTVRDRLRKKLAKNKK